MTNFPIIDMSPPDATADTAMFALLRDCALFMLGMVVGAATVAIGVSLALNIF